jgi:hypothetical protein
MAVRKMGAPLHRVATAIVEEIYGEAKARLSEPPGPGNLIAAILGAEALEYDRRRVAPPATVFQRAGCWKIGVHAVLSDEATTMAEADALARWWCQTRPLKVRHPELVEQLSIGIVLPPPALAVAVRVYGLSVEEIAETYVCPADVVRAQMWALSKPTASGTFLRIDSAG